MNAHRILIIEDEEVLARNLATYLQHLGYVTRSAESAEEGLGVAETLDPDLILLDYNLPGIDGLEAIARLRRSGSTARVVLITGYGNPELARHAIDDGAVAYLTKPVSMRDVSLLIASLVGDGRKVAAKEQNPGNPGDRMSHETLVGASPAAVTLRRTIQALLDAEEQSGPGAAGATVLLTGEAGSGRRRVARTLHELGQRRRGPFVEFDCWGCPPELIEAVLFGDVRNPDSLPREPGANGMVEQARGGTLFLDGIETMPLAAQERLLHLTAHRLLRPVGSPHARSVDVRTIVATREPLKPLLLQGRIKPALYYRLRTVMVDIPPLRDRGADVLLLARHFLARSQRRDRPDLRLSEAAQEQMLAHAWPGNVRELRSLIEHAALNASAPLIEHLPIGRHPPVEERAPRHMPSYEDIARTLAWTRGDALRASRLLGIDQARVLTLLHAGRHSSSLLPSQAPPAA